MIAPKLFISYSWSGPVHEQWVVAFATELCESGVDVILDKWELNEGNDALAFMEQMVTNPEIKKVLMVVDRTYAEKADGRAGGVGTETQIISKDVYENQAQDKFVAVVSEKNDEGQPYLPTYYRSRIYIDLSEPDNYAENFEKLLRWIFDKPLFVKPELGASPPYLDDGEHVSLGTTPSFKRVVDAIKSNRPHALGALDDYLITFVNNLERFRLDKPQGEFDDAVVENIEDFAPYRNEAIQLIMTISQYSPNDEFWQRIHRFFESLIPYMYHPLQITQWNEWDFDNFRFIVHELFLYALAILIRYERFDQAVLLLEQQYYLPGNSNYGRDVMVDSAVFWERIQSLRHRNVRLDLRRQSVRADLLKQRCIGVGIEFRHLMQADFVAFMRGEIAVKNDHTSWWPETLLYLGGSHGPFEIFARSKSMKYFNLVKGLLNINSPADLRPLLDSYVDGKRQLPKWQFDSINPAKLLGYDQLATQP